MCQLELQNSYESQMQAYNGTLEEYPKWSDRRRDVWGVQDQGQKGPD